MQRIQFYPSVQLAAILNGEAQRQGVSISTLVTDLLEEYYGLTTNKLSITQLTSAVLKEVEEYIKNPSKVPFDLNTASETFRNIEMTCGKKPQTVRASIGRSFASKLGKAPFNNVRKKLDMKGNQILSANNAIMYEIF